MASVAGGEGRFGTPDTLAEVCRISSAVHSTTLPPLRGDAVGAMGVIQKRGADDKSEARRRSGFRGNRSIPRPSGRCREAGQSVRTRPISSSFTPWPEPG